MTTDIQQVLERATARPWAVGESWHRRAEECGTTIVDENGKTLADTLNRSYELTEIFEEYDESGHRFCETKGLNDARLIVAAVNSFESNRKLIRELAEALLHIQQRNHKEVGWCDGCAAASRALTKAREAGVL